MNFAKHVLVFVVVTLLAAIVLALLMPTLDGQFLDPDWFHKPLTNRDYIFLLSYMIAFYLLNYVENQ